MDSATSSRLRLPAACLLLLLALPACHDASSDPLSVVLAEEVRSVLSANVAELARDVGPEGVGQMLIAGAEGELERVAESNGEVEGVDLLRARRLIRGARLAFESGEHFLAIQRAFYACQLLEGRCLGPGQTP